MQDVSDYLIIGAGSAGCVLAARLSENPAHRVLLLEAGPPDRDPWIHLPAGYARLFASGRYDWGYATEPEPELNERRVNWPRGRVLGGSGSINGLVFLRGSPHDFDRWAQSGATGWSYDDVLPFFRRMEQWLGGVGTSRGREGPLPVSQVTRLSKGAEAFIAACEGMGYRRNSDMNDGDIAGVMPIQMNVRKGRRISTARAYLHPALKRPNLQLRTGFTAQRILLDGTRVTGVQARDDRGALHNLHARQVVLCAGALASPQLLMLSGLGDGEHLRSLGIDVALHCPQIGLNLQDHLIARLAFRTRRAGTVNEVMRSRWSLARAVGGYALRRSGPLAVGATEATLFAAVTPGAEEAEVQFQFINFALGSAGYVLTPEPGMMLNFGQCRPESRGSVRLRSGNSDDKPLIRANYLDSAADQRIMIDAMRLGRRIARAEPLAGLIEADLAPSAETPDDAAMLDYIRAAGTTVYHPCGTCRMGSDAAAVLDPQLRLRGIQGLRVADASVMPLIPSSNIQAAVIMVAEHAAELLRRGS
ncbi:GMC family oxidoreductase [Pseudoroseomonas globiformis]|uniref:GMC family oxidoreductase n=1 Tax=Teichococcus globiformis TaxID=2307229 RepID=A0ABV7G7P9_9PROT